MGKIPANFTFELPHVDYGCKTSGHEVQFGLNLPEQFKIPPQQTDYKFSGEYDSLLASKNN